MKTYSFGFVKTAGFGAALVAAGLWNHIALGATFTTGDLAIFQAAASANNTTASIVEISATTAGQSGTGVQTIAIPSADPNGLRFSGSATSTGYLSHTDDRTLLTFTGHRSTNASVNANTLTPRGVGTMNASGTYALQTTYTGVSGNQTRSASSLDDANWYVGDQGGVYTNGSSTPATSGNLRSVKAFGGSLYVFAASSSFSAVSTVNVPAGTVTGLPGMPIGDTNNQDFYMVQSGANGSSYDVLYTLAATGNTAGTISKYSLVGGSWTANSSYTTAFGGFGMAAQHSGNGANLFVTTGQGALTANSVLKLFDSSGYNSAINITTANNVTLYTTPSGTILKGIDFAPASVPEPTTTALLAVAAMACFGRRRSV